MISGSVAKKCAENSNHGMVMELSLSSKCKEVCGPCFCDFTFNRAVGGKFQVGEGVLTAHGPNFGYAQNTPLNSW